MVLAILIQINFLDTDIKNVNTPYVLPEEFERLFSKQNSKFFSIVHLNVRSLKNNAAVLNFFNQA